MNPFSKNRTIDDKIIFIGSVTIALVSIAFVTAQLGASWIKTDQVYDQTLVDQQQHAAYIYNLANNGLKNLTTDQFLALTNATSTTPGDQTELYEGHSLLTTDALRIFVSYFNNGRQLNYIAATHAVIPDLVAQGWTPASAASMATWTVLAMKTSVLIDPSLADPDCTPQTCPVLTQSQIIQTLENDKDFHFSLSYISAMFREIDAADEIENNTSTASSTEPENDDTGQPSEMSIQVNQPLLRCI